MAQSARIAWFATLGAEVERDRPAPAVSLPPPGDVRAIRGRGQITIEWSPVAGAAGYLVHRGPSADGPFEPIDQQIGDVLAVPHGPYLDTTAPADAAAWYAVSSVATIEAGGGALSEPGQPDPGAARRRDHACASTRRGSSGPFTGLGARWSVPSISRCS